MIISLRNKFLERFLGQWICTVLGLCPCTWIGFLRVLICVPLACLAWFILTVVSTWPGLLRMYQQRLGKGLATPTSAGNKTVGWCASQVSRRAVVTSCFVHTCTVQIGTDQTVLVNAAKLSIVPMLWWDRSRSSSGASLGAYSGSM